MAHGVHRRARGQRRRAASCQQLQSARRSPRRINPQAAKRRVYVAQQSSQRNRPGEGGGRGGPAQLPTMGLSDGAGYVYGSREAMSVETMVGEIVGTDSAIFIVFSWTKMLLCAWLPSPQLRPCPLLLCLPLSESLSLLAC